MKKKLRDLVPPWADLSAHLSGLIVGLVLCALASYARFQSLLNHAVEALYAGHIGESPLLEGAKMKYFGYLICGNDPVYSWYSAPVFTGFSLLFLGAAILAAYNYSGFRNGSKSYYLMRRLPDKWEYHRRCLALPLAATLAGLVLIPILMGLFYVLYLHATPAQCLQPGQWEVFRDSLQYLILPVHLRFWEVPSISYFPS